MVKCPKCMGEKIEPRGKTFYCYDCKEEFETAAVALPEEKKQPKTKK